MIECISWEAIMQLETSDIEFFAIRCGTNVRTIATTNNCIDFNEVSETV